MCTVNSSEKFTILLKEYFKDPRKIDKYSCPIQISSFIRSQRNHCVIVQCARTLKVTTESSLVVKPHWYSYRALSGRNMGGMTDRIDIHVIFIMTIKHSHTDTQIFKI